MGHTEVLTLVLVLIMGVEEYRQEDCVSKREKDHVEELEGF